MYNFFIFIKKYSFFILFLILEVICIFMLIQSLPYQNRKMVNMSNNFVGKIYKTESNIINYFSLKQQNESLAQANALLMTALYNNVVPTDSTTLASCSLSLDTVLTFIPALVINNSIFETNNYLVLDKGRLDGIEKDMGVICDEGIVGKVANVSNHYASVISMLHPYSIVSARFKDNQNIANVKWDNSDYRYGIADDIPSHLILNHGDTLVTSGFSNVYPADVMIGTIEEIIETEERDFNTARIRFSTDFSTLRYVYVIKNKYRSELDSLAEQQK